MDLASVVCRCLSPILVHPSARGDTGSPWGDPASHGGAGHLVTTAPAPGRVSPGLGRASRKRCSEAVLGVPCHREKDGPHGAGGHPGSCLVLDRRGAASLWHYLLQPGMGHVPGHDQVVPMTGGDTSPNPQASRALPYCPPPWHNPRVGGDQPCAARAARGGTHACSQPANLLCCCAPR